MLSENLLTNKKIPEKLSEQICKILNDNEKPLFALMGDLDLDGKYADSVMVATETRLIVFDHLYENGFYSVPYTSIRGASVKRMYGNAIFKVDNGVKVENIFRFTYSIATLGDAVAQFSQAMGQEGGCDMAAEMEVVDATFKKMKCVCEKCGRTLSRPGAPCQNCASKSRIVKKLIRYIKPELKPLSFCMALSLFITVMALAPPFATRLLVDDILPNRNARGLGMVICTLLVVYILQYSVGAVRGHLMRKSGDRIVAALRNDIYEKAQYLPMGFYDKTSTGQVISRVSSDTNTLQAFMLRITQEAVVQFFLAIGIIVIMFIQNWKLTIFSLAPVPLVAVGARYFGKKISPIYHRIWKRWSAVTSVLTDTLPGIRVIKSFTSEERASKKFKSYNNEWLKEDMHASIMANIFPNAVTFFVTCGSLLIWGIGGSWVMNDTGEITLGLLVSFISYASMFYNPISFFANLSDSFQHALSSAERVLDIIDAEPEPNFGKGNCVPALRGKIEFRNVNFSFDKTKKALSDINLTIEPGDIVGIVGTTGSGKSTLVNLLMRFYDNYDGEILVDGHDIRDIDLASFREKIGYVQQEPMMFRDSIFNNIAYSRPNASVEEVIKAADVANAHGFISQLPDAYDTMLGERGVGLSGGERQRLSIARAVLKNPSMLIFDEATAAVDSETEHLIQQAIERLISGRTTLMIAHRLSTLRKANKIIVVDKGRIIENGSHEELMALKGKYYKLIEIQSMSEKIRQGKEAENFE